MGPMTCLSDSIEDFESQDGANRAWRLWHKMKIMKDAQYDFNGPARLLD